MAPDFDALVAKVFFLAEQLYYQSGKDCVRWPVLRIWYADTQEERQAAYDQAQEDYGVPMADIVERYTLSGQHSFWQQLEQLLGTALVDVYTAIAVSPVSAVESLERQPDLFPA